MYTSRSIIRLQHNCSYKIATQSLFRDVSTYSIDSYSRELARGNAPANAIMLSQELGLQLKAMPDEALVKNFPQLVRSINPPAQEP